MNKPYEIIFENEIRFGPSYFRLLIKGKEVKGAIFGDCCSELSDGKYLAIQEWLTTDYQEGPRTRVAVFNLEDSTVARLESINKGFAQSFELENGIFNYTKFFTIENKTINCEVQWNKIENWIPFNV